MNLKTPKIIFRLALYILLLPTLYGIVALLLSTITINKPTHYKTTNKSIYLNTNGVHIDIIIPKKYLNYNLISDLKHNEQDHYLSFGWGDENFYINTPTWGDLTFANAFKALFLKSSTLMHVTRYESKKTDWVELKVNNLELQQLNTYIQNSFKTDDKNTKIILKNQGYSSIDDFYKAHGSYSCFKTCNTWVNLGLKKSGLKACLWTPFDFTILNKYKKNTTKAKGFIK